MDTRQKIRILSEQHALGIRKLIRVGDSFALTVPKTWVLMFCTEVDEEYYFSLDIADKSLILNPITLEDIEGIEIKEKK